jgi:hypothetical protein
VVDPEVGGRRVLLVLLSCLDEDDAVDELEVGGRGGGAGRGASGCEDIQWWLWGCC